MNKEEFTNLIEEVSTINKKTVKLFVSLDYLYNAGLPKDTQVINRKVNWNGMQFNIIPNNYLEVDNKIFAIPYEEPPIKIRYE